jgi:hypothetical protein
MLTSIRKAVISDSETATEIRRIEDADSARLWLADGLPIADVLTLLEFRRRFEFPPDAARAYAIETLLALMAETPPQISIPPLIERSPLMPLLEIAQNRPISRGIRLEESTAEMIDQYAANFQVSAEEFVQNALTYVFVRHRDVRKFLRTMESRPAAERCCKRRRPQRGTGNGVRPELLDRVAEVAKALEAMSPPPPHE